MKRYYLLLSYFLLLGCQSSTISISSNGDLSLKMSAQFGTDLISELVRSVPSPDTFTLEFVDKNNATLSGSDMPSTITLKAFSDPQCQNQTIGELTYIQTKNNSNIEITNLRYSQIEDIYLEISGTDFLSKCAPAPIHVASATPVTFVRTGPTGVNSLVEVAGRTITAPLQFKIVDAANQPVQNARLSYQGQYSSQSNAQGIVSLSFKVGTQAIDYSSSNATNPYVIDLSFQGQTIDQQTVDFDIVPELGSQIATLSTLDLSNQAGTINMVIADQYNNILHPSLYSITGFDLYSDPFCTTSSSADVSYTYQDNPSLDPNDTQTWFHTLSITYTGTGSVYIKLSYQTQLSIGSETNSISDCVGPVKLN